MKKYGNPPYRTAVIHGGPGAPGEMAPVAFEISSVCGILEPYQTKYTIKDLIIELHSQIEECSVKPLILIGHSWGAWLSILFASEYPDFVRKIILIGCGPLEEKYADKIMETRLSRLKAKEKKRVSYLMKMINGKESNRQNEILKEFGDIMTKTDTFKIIEFKEENPLEVNLEQYTKIWEEASGLRKKGVLLYRLKTVKCPIFAIHGDYDPHPFEGVKFPLSSSINNFKYCIIPNCGHTPWLEKNARTVFFDILKKEIASP